MCQGGEIPLQHNRFPLQAVGSCNDGAIIGQSVAVENNCYKSHLNLTLSSALVGRSVSCFVDDGSSQTSIGTVVLTINTTSEFVTIITNFTYIHVARSLIYSYYGGN